MAKQNQVAAEEESKASGAFTIVNDKGLHTRPSAELVRCASNFKCHLVLHYQNLSVNAKSLLGILMLAAPKGARIAIEGTGEDASTAVRAILRLARNKFCIRY